MISIFEADTKWNYTKEFFETKYQFEILKLVVRSFCFGPNTFSPFGIKRQKRRNLRGLIILPFWGLLSHPVLEGKPNVNHVCDRISNSRTQQLHNPTSSHSAQIIT